MELAMILFSLIISFVCLALASYPYGSTTSSFMNPSRSFSSRMSMIWYFDDVNFSAPSSFSSILVLFFIFNRMRTSNGNRKNSTYLETLLLDYLLRDDLGFDGKTLIFQLRSLVGLSGGKHVPPQGKLVCILLFLSLMMEH